MRAAGSVLAGTLLAGTLAACASHAHTPLPAETAEAVTRAVYANDFDATTAKFDDATKTSVTRSQLGEMSDRMHALGEFKALTQRSASPDAGKFEYVAAFTSGQLLVQLRLDADGKIAAYRIVPGGVRSAATASAQN